MRARPALALTACAAALAGTAALVAGQSAGTAIPVHGYTIVNTYPHDPEAFTQGLQYHNGFLYEGTGLTGQSSIRKVDLTTGKVLQRRGLAPSHFGEGITIRNAELIQLTWQSGLAFVYDLDTFAPKRTFSYRGEGWGLTQDSSNLIMSDGTDVLRVLDPATFAERRRIRVHASGLGLRDLNELEFVKGEIFANVWMTDRIARINPGTGRVAGWIDLTGLLPARDRISTDQVLNGIAYDAAGDRLFVTGKLWPKVFEIKIK
jgi:glutaminyl-peptide cyclotransferase